MNRKIITISLILSIFFLISSTYYLLEVNTINSLGVSLLYPFSITFIILIFLILFRKPLKNHLGFIDGRIKIFRFETGYWDFCTGVLALTFFLSMGYTSKINTLKNETKYVIGELVKKSDNVRVEGHSIKLKRNKHEVELYPSYKTWKDLKIGKNYKVKIYEGWLGIDYYYKDSFDIKEVK